MNILVTGAAGYIGSILTPTLLKAGHSVTALDNFMFGQSSLLDCCIDEKLTVVRGDVRNRSLMEGLIKKADAIFPPDRTAAWYFSTGSSHTSASC